MTQCVVVADDLTGACDAAGPFATMGLRAVVRLKEEDETAADVVALSTDSRDVDPAEAKRRLRAIAPTVRALAPRVIFKKIDSTLRGNTGHEIVAAREAFGCEAAVVNPAFPAMWRIVIAGSLMVPTDRKFRSIRVAEYIEKHSGCECRHASRSGVGGAIESGVSFVSTEAETDLDLYELAKRLLEVKREVLWAGSAGLAGALARRLGGRKRGRPEAPAHGPVLFCIGSDHPATMRQQKQLLDEREIVVDPSGIGEGKHSLLRVPRDVTEDEVRTVVCDCRPAAVLLSGGDTASLVCRALRARAIELIGEFSAGIPIGVPTGRRFRRRHRRHQVGRVRRFERPDPDSRLLSWLKNSR